MRDFEQLQRGISEAFEVATRAVCALSIGDCDPEYRAAALEGLSDALTDTINGIRAREREAKRDAVLASLAPEQKNALKPYLRSDL